MNNKGEMGFGKILGLFGVFALVVIVVGGLLINYNRTTEKKSMAEQEAIEEAKALAEQEAGIEPDVTEDRISLSTMPYRFDFLAKDIDGQDTDSDLDIDVYKWNAEDNADVKAQDYLDCAIGKTNFMGAVIEPLKWDGDIGGLQIKVTNKNLCDVNWYKVYNEYTSGNEETSIGKYLTKVTGGIDRDPKAGNSSQTTILNAGEMYVACAQDTSENTDLIPFCVLMEVPKTTNGDKQSIADEDYKVDLFYEYYSDAFTHSRTDFEIECEDSDTNQPTVTDAEFNGFIHSSLTTAKTLTWIKCDIKFRVTKDGYAFPVKNPLTTSQIEHGYLLVEPMGFNRTTGGAHCSNASTDRGSTGCNPKMTGTSIVYDVSGLINGLPYASMTVCGQEITTDSTSDALQDEANEKLRPSDVSCLSNLWDESSFTIPVKLSSIVVKYASENNTDSYVNTGEEVAEFGLYGIINTTDTINKDLTG